MATISIWRGRVAEGKTEEFDRWLREEAIPELRREDGLEALHVGRADPEECVLITVWRDPGSAADGRAAAARSQSVAPSPPEGLVRMVDRVERYQALSEELSSVARGAQ